MRSPAHSSSASTARGKRVNSAEENDGKSPSQSSWWLQAAGRTGLDHSKKTRCGELQLNSVEQGEHVSGLNLWLVSANSSLSQREFRKIEVNYERTTRDNSAGSGCL